MKKEFSREQLLKWINNNPHNEATLIMEVPLAATTLARIKSGSYKPSEMLANAIHAVTERTKSEKNKNTSGES